MNVTEGKFAFCCSLECLKAPRLIRSWGCEVLLVFVRFSLWVFRPAHVEFKFRVFAFSCEALVFLCFCARCPLLVCFCETLVFRSVFFCRARSCLLFLCSCALCLRVLRLVCQVHRRPRYSNYVLAGCDVDWRR